jgi:hypothetical protein
MTASEQIARDCALALALLRRSIGTKCGIAQARIREQAARLRQANSFSAADVVRFIDAQITKDHP